MVGGRSPEFRPGNITITEQTDGFGEGIDNKVTMALPCSLAGNGRLPVRLHVSVADESTRNRLLTIRSPMTEVPPALRHRSRNSIQFRDDQDQWQAVRLPRGAILLELFPRKPML